MKRIALFVLLPLLLLSACGRIIDEPPEASFTTESETAMEIPETLAAYNSTADATTGTDRPHTPSAKPMPTIPDERVHPLSFTVGFQVNTHGYVDGGGGAFLVRTRQELYAFYESDLDGNKQLYQANLAKYDEAFFEGKALLLITRQEPSGSNRLQVNSVMRVIDSLQVTITRTAPGIGTMDMARWVIAIELNKGSLPGGDIPINVYYN